MQAFLPRFLSAGAIAVLLALLWVQRPAFDRVVATQGPSVLEKQLLRGLGSTSPGGRPRPVRLDFDPAIPEAARPALARAFTRALRRRSGYELGTRGEAFRLEPTPWGGLALVYPDGRRSVRPLADFTSLLPPFLAILVAILLRRVLPALFLGVLLGAFLAAGPAGAVQRFALDWLAGRALGEEFKLQILGFIVFLCAAVGLMTRMGGIDGLVNLVKRWAKTARSGQLAAWFLGLVVFFDDYANTIVVGSTMRPLLDRLKVSREKLAYIVDSTAAPVAGLSMLSTWVAYEVSQFAGRLPEVTRPDGVPYEQSQGFEVFLQTLPYRFYCIFTLIFVVMTVLLRREWGPMLAAERRARRTGRVLREGARPTVSAELTDARAKPGAPARAANALLPLLTLVLVTIWQIYATGESALAEQGAAERGLRAVLSAADSTWAILAGAGAAAILAALLALGQRILGPLEVLVTSLRSARALVIAMAILVLAWCIGFACEELGTAYYLVALVREGFPAVLLPSILFLLSCLIAFATGSSWSTMAILLPNVVLLSHRLGEHSGFGGPALMVLSIGAVLEGSIFGDHCSPISDTTVLSSVASASDHLDHVRTQIPYALLTMATALLAGYLPVALIGPGFWPASLVLGVTGLGLFLGFAGRDPEA